MYKKQLFNEWMKLNTSVSPSTVDKYVRAISINSEELNEHKVLEGSLYDISDPIIVENMKVNFLSIPALKEKDERGNRMYSSAFKYYKQFVENIHEQELLEEIIRQEISYEKEIVKLLKSNNSTTKIVVDMVQAKPEHQTTKSNKLWVRNPKLAAEVVAAADFLCQVNNDHKHFTSKFNKQNYVEAHHLIPMQFQEEFEYSLDVYANIVSLCLVCHKKLHYSEFSIKKEIIDILYSSRKDRLSKCGIAISINELYEYYKD